MFNSGGGGTEYPRILKPRYYTRSQKTWRLTASCNCHIVRAKPIRYTHALLHAYSCKCTNFTNRSVDVRRVLITTVKHCWRGELT
jgi:hypothetical protein